MSLHRLASVGLTRLALAAVVGAIALLPACNCPSVDPSSEGENTKFEQITSPGTVQITSNPSGANVYIMRRSSDQFGETIGQTPFRMNVEATGVAYIFRLTARGYVDYTVDLRPSPRNPDVAVTINLEPDIRLRDRGSSDPTEQFHAHPEDRNLFGMHESSGTLPPSRYPSGAYNSRYSSERID